MYTHMCIYIYIYIYIFIYICTLTRMYNICVHILCRVSRDSVLPNPWTRFPRREARKTAAALPEPLRGLGGRATTATFIGGFTFIGWSFTGNTLLNLVGFFHRQGP